MEIKESSLDCPKCGKNGFSYDGSSTASDTIFTCSFCDSFIRKDELMSFHKNKHDQILRDMARKKIKEAFKKDSLLSKSLIASSVSS